MSYNRYVSFIEDDKVKFLPFIKLPSKASDKTETYTLGVSRLDLISDKYYSDPNYDWLIMLANPSLGSLEFSIVDQSDLIIPFPLETSLKDYQTEVSNYIKYYGL